MIKRFIGVMFLAVLVCAQLLPVGVAAQALPGIYVRSVVAEMDEYAAGDTVVAQATIENTEDRVVHDLRYVVRLLGDYDESGLGQTQYAQVSSEAFSMEPGESKTVDVALQIPLSVSGKLGLDVQAVTTAGIPLGWKEAFLTVSGATAAPVEVVSATMMVDGQSFHTSNGPTVHEGMNASLILDLVSEEAVTLVPRLVIYERTLVADAPLYDENTAPLSLPGGTASSTFTISLPNFEGTAGVYSGKLVLEDENRTQVLPDIPFRYIVAGDMVTIHSLNTDVAEISAGGVVTVYTELTGMSYDLTTSQQPELTDLTVTAQLVNAAGVVIGQTETTTDLAGEPVALAFQVMADGVPDEARVRVEVIKDGVVLGSKEQSLTGGYSNDAAIVVAPPESFDSVTDERSPFLWWVFVGAILFVLACTAVFVFVLSHRLGKGTDSDQGPYVGPTAMLFIGLMVLGLSSPMSLVHATTFHITDRTWIPVPPLSYKGGSAKALPQSRQWANPATDFVSIGNFAMPLFLNTPEDTLEPGEEFWVSGTRSDYICLNSPSYIFTWASFQGISHEKYYAHNIKRSGEKHVTEQDRFSLGPFYAPSQPGTYRIDFGLAKLEGYMYHKPFWFSVGNKGYIEITVVAPEPPPPPNNPPNPPVIEGVTRGVINTSYSFKFTAIDPDDDQIRYGIDWDNNSAVDSGGWTGWVNSNTPVSRSFSWPNVGRYTFKALTEDEHSAQSNGWGTHTIDIVRPPSGSITASPLRVLVGAKSQISWSSQYTSSCRVESNYNGGSWTGLSGSQTSNALTNDTTYRLMCLSDVNGQMVQTGQVTVATYNKPTISTCGGRSVVRSGENFELCWDTKESDPTSCVINGPGVYGTTLSTQTGRMTISVNTTSDFTINCEFGSATETIKVLPQVQET